MISRRTALAALAIDHCAAGLSKIAPLAVQEGVTVCVELLNSNETQELNYRAVATAIADLNFGGFVAHEFNSTRADPLESLLEAYRICSVYAEAYDQ